MTNALIISRLTRRYFFGLQYSLRYFHYRPNSALQKLKKRVQCTSRATIKPIISHVKFDCRTERNYLKGEIGNKVNAILAAAAFNLRKSLSELILWLKIYLKIFLANKNNTIKIHTSKYIFA